MNELLDIYENDLPPLIEHFNPDIILVSAGMTCMRVILLHSSI